MEQRLEPQPDTQTQEWVTDVEEGGADTTEMVHCVQQDSRIRSCNIERIDRSNHKQSVICKND